MKVAGDWATVYVGLSILFLAVLFAICLPETLKRTNPSDDYYYQYSEGNLSTKTTNLTTRDLLPKIRASLLRCREFLRLLLRTNLLMLLASILLTTFGRDAQTVLMQYVTVKFGWSWGEVRFSVTPFYSRFHLFPRFPPRQPDTQTPKHSSNPTLSLQQN